MVTGPGCLTVATYYIKSEGGASLRAGPRPQTTSRDDKDELNVAYEIDHLRALESEALHEYQGNLHPAPLPVTSIPQLLV